MEFKNVFTMKQPDLGKKISELRKLKGFTQEELVEKCNINVRTIQRIEAGDVTPRSFTVKTILEALGLDAGVFFEDTIHEENKIHLSDTDKDVLRASWISGIFLIITSIIGMVVEFMLMSDGDFYNDGLFYRLGWSIPFLAALFFFLRGYKKLGDIFQNKALVTATYIYFGIEIIITLITIAFSVFDFSDVTSDVLSGIVVLVLFGAAELILGIAILKLKEHLGSFAQIVGILKIVNGAMFVTVLFSPIAAFLMMPILIAEIILIYNATQKINQ
jgi:transcriptional regulator with XRE-family HTH domain